MKGIVFLSNNLLPFIASSRKTINKAREEGVAYNLCVHIAINQWAKWMTWSLFHLVVSPRLPLSSVKFEFIFGIIFILSAIR